MPSLKVIFKCFLAGFIAMILFWMMQKVVPVPDIMYKPAAVFMMILAGSISSQDDPVIVMLAFFLGLILEFTLVALAIWYFSRRKRTTSAEIAKL